jgi:hypothetical protein
MGVKMDINNKDSRIKSMVEVIFNIVVGFTINFFANMFILPMFGMPFSLKSFGLIGVLYTIIAIIRGYLIRRLFVNGFYEDVWLKFIKKSKGL